MNARQELDLLQQAQQKHDEQHHRDIFYLSYPQRMAHLVFHFAKYSGRLAELQKGADNKRFEATLIDTLIVALSAANIFNIKLSETVLSEDLSQYDSLDEVAQIICDVDAPSSASSSEWFFQRLAQATGRMAKACESLDHMEEFNYRRELTEGILEIIRGVIVAGERAGIDLTDSTRRRWQQIETRFVL